MSEEIAILGSTGSIGKQTLEVVRAFPNQLKVVAIAAKDEIDLIVEQINEFSPRLVSVESNQVKEAVLKKIKKPVDIYTGKEGLSKVATIEESKILVVAIPGSMSLMPTLSAIRLNKDIALATKEVLVTAGKLFMDEAKAHNIKILPIDSEHSAVLQCLTGENIDRVKKIILTASGGPFLNTPAEKLALVTAEEALKHPTWKMGPKITIDSATLMNKGFEVLEAHYLFGLDLSKIEVVIHPQSIIHSMVEYVDGSILAQLGAPDMRVPIQYALFRQERLPNIFKKLDFSQNMNLSFEKPDKKKFPCLEFAYEAGRRGGTLGSVINASNEEAIKLFLSGKIKYLDIAAKIKQSMNAHKNIENPTLEEVLQADTWARDFVNT